MSNLTVAKVAGDFVPHDTQPKNKLRFDEVTQPEADMISGAQYLTGGAAARLERELDIAPGTLLSKARVRVIVEAERIEE